MTATLELTAEDRRPFAYIMLLEIAHLGAGTREHRDAAAGLQSIHDGLSEVPEGPVEVVFANDEIYFLGIRDQANASELEEYWLDNRASIRHRGEPAPFPSDDIELAIRTYYLEVITDPESWDWKQVQPIFLELGFKIDRALTAGAPRVRQIYQKERIEIIRRTRAAQRERAIKRGRTYPRGVEIDAWRPAIRPATLGPGEMTEVKLEGVRIMLANVDGEYYALDGGCTHAPELSAIKGLAAGTLDPAAMCVTCPWHGAQYNLRSGRAVRQPYAPEFNRDHLIAGRLLSVVDFRRTAKDIRTYETKVEDGFVWVNVI